MTRRDFDIDAFLARPLVARLASAGPQGPVVRPIWFLWEEGSFWWLTGAWSNLSAQLAADPRVALVIDTCDLATGEVRTVSARGRAHEQDYDPARALRKLSRYLGDDQGTWDAERFGDVWADDGSSWFVELPPDRLDAKDLSYVASPSAPRG